MRNHPHLLVIGASGRFLARSASLAGYQVSVIDLFGDSDTRQLSASSQGDGRPKRMHPLVRRVAALGDLVVELPLDVAERSPYYTVLFSGGCENYPEFFDSDFWGSAIVAGPARSSIESLLCLRRVKNACQQLQIQTPNTIQDSDTKVAVSENWLVKRVRSGGGLQIRRWNDTEPVGFGAGYYLQEEISGTTISGCYVAAEINGRTTTALLGACQQLPNRTPDDFRYCGSLGPVLLDTHLHEEIERVGRRIAAEFFLSGVFGIDFISAANGLYLVDINPRITASAELIERFYRAIQPQFTIVGSHLDATLEGRLPIRLSEFEEHIFSKRIIYSTAARPLIIDESMAEFFNSVQWITDIPAVGTEIQPGHPLVTVHASAQDRNALAIQSAKRVQDLKKYM